MKRVLVVNPPDEVVERVRLYDKTLIGFAHPKWHVLLLHSGIRVDLLEIRSHTRSGCCLNTTKPS